MKEIEAVKPQVTEIVSQARGLVVKDHASSEQAGLILSAIKAMRKRVAELCDPVCKATDIAHKAAVKVRESLDGPLKAEEFVVKGKVSHYHAEQESLRLAEERKLQEQANEKARKKAADEALLLDALDEPEAAQEMREAPVVAPVVSLVPVATPANVTIVANWKWRKKADFDIAKVPPEYLMLNEVMLNQLAKAMKSAMNVPGIQTYDAGSVRVGG